MKISIVTVCRNDREGLAKTFESIRAQNSKDYEWWVVDGGSSDGTARWLQENHHFSGGWISEPDEGIYDAMNKGAGLCGGDYLLFMNSGDGLAASDVLTRLVSAIDGGEEPPDFIYGDALDVEENGHAHYRKARSAAHIFIGMPTRHQAMLYRRDQLGSCPYPADMKLSGDYALTARFLTREDARVRRVDFPICLFSLGGKHTEHRVRALAEDFTIRRRILGQGLPVCTLLYLVHWLHHHARTLAPDLNRRIIYRSSKCRERRT